MMRHRQAQKLLYEYLRGELEASDRSAIDRHLAECPTCSLELQALKSAVDTLDAHYVSPDSERPQEFWNAFAGQVEDRIRQRSASPRARRPLSSFIERALVMNRRRVALAGSVFAAALALRLEDELSIDPDALLSLTEVAELLGFARIEKGDITLTPLGETYADASILARKEIFATRIRRLPMFRWLLNMLERADTHMLEWDVIQSALELDFLPEEAEKQIDIAVNWGRYAELVAYDDGSAKIYLEEAEKR